ncbi:hypothetical protein GCM10010470_01990 [Saccharopolyspora taberi]|uniref:Uncharacterized protein n=1 Tax=Saccharopolyspora taberi TaxID=60895 RepID=A0ABN3V1U1_9PSEU
MTKGSAEYVRRYYGVPAKQGMSVRVDGQSGRITGFRDAHLLVRFDGESRSTPCHPTWRVEYQSE